MTAKPKRLPALLLILATLACNLPAANPTHLAPTPNLLTSAGPADSAILATPAHTLTSQPPAATEPPPATLDDLLEQVSEDRLMGYVEALAAIHSRHVNSLGNPQATTLIKDRFSAIDGLTVTVDTFPLNYYGQPTTQTNVIATLPGVSTDTVLVGAHYDSRSTDIADARDRAPGADDNATGVAVLIEMARLMAAQPEPPQATVVFVAFAAEEIGSLGSAHFIEAVDISSPRAVFVLDIVGNAAGPRGEGAIRVFSSPDHAPSRQVMRTVDVTASQHSTTLDVLPQPTGDRPGRYSDHLNFSAAGIPAVRLIEAVEDTERQHSPNDLPQTISPSYLQQAAQLALACVAGAANLSPPDNLHVSHDPSPTPDSTLLNAIWSPVPGATHYLVGLRRLDSLAFEEVIKAPGVYVEDARLADYDLISVAAVDSSGRISLFSDEAALSR